MQASHSDAGVSMLFRRGCWVLSSYSARSINEPFWFSTQKIVDTGIISVIMMIMMIRTELSAEGKYQFGNEKREDLEGEGPY